MSRTRSRELIGTFHADVTGRTQRVQLVDEIVSEGSGGERRGDDASRRHRRDQHRRGRRCRRSTSSGCCRSPWPAGHHLGQPGQPGQPGRRVVVVVVACATVRVVEPLRPLAAAETVTVYVPGVVGTVRLVVADPLALAVKVTVPVPPAPPAALVTVMVTVSPGCAPLTESATTEPGCAVDGVTTTVSEVGGYCAAAGSARPKMATSRTAAAPTNFFTLFLPGDEVRPNNSTTGAYGRNTSSGRLLRSPQGVGDRRGAQDRSSPSKTHRSPGVSLMVIGPAACVLICSGATCS